mgnify:CR=1 FL=1
MRSSSENGDSENPCSELFEQLEKQKLAHRVKLANLPFEKKIKIIVELQKIDNALARAAGRKTGKVWEI